MEYSKNHDIFISYRSHSGFMTARIFNDRLVQRGYRVFFDVETLRNGVFDMKLLEKVKECHDFILILSPNSLDRCANENDWVRIEICHAIKHGKNIVPVYEPGFAFPDDKGVPDEIKNLFRYQAVRADHEYFDAAFGKFLGFLETPPRLMSHMSGNLILNLILVPLTIALLFLSTYQGFQISHLENMRSESLKETAEKMKNHKEEATKILKFDNKIPKLKNLEEKSANPVAPSF
jgi:hypothetical protein